MSNKHLQANINPPLPPLDGASHQGGQDTASAIDWRKSGENLPLRTQNSKRSSLLDGINTSRGVGGIIFSRPSWFIALILAFGFQFSAFSQAQSLAFGLYGRLSPDSLTPTVELSWPLGDLTLGLQAQRDALGLSAKQALELGPGGRIEFSGRGNLGFAGWGVHTQLNGTVGPVAADLSAGYSNTSQSNLWVGDDPSNGWYGRANGRYRLSSRETLGLGVGISDNLSGVVLGKLEATYALRQTDTLTFGAGIDASNFYGLVGWRGEISEAGALLDATLRAGLLNRLDAALTLPLSDEDVNNLKLRLTLAYPWAAKLGLEVANLRADAAYDGGFSLWLRYTFNFGEE